MKRTMLAAEFFTGFKSHVSVWTWSQNDDEGTVDPRLGPASTARRGKPSSADPQPGTCSVQARFGAGAYRLRDDNCNDYCRHPLAELGLDTGSLGFVLGS